MQASRTISSLPIPIHLGRFTPIIEMSTPPTDLTYVVTGRRDTGIAFPRRDIHDLQKNHPEQFSLFILSLLAVQYPDSEIPLMPPGFTAAAQGIVPEGGYWYNLTVRPVRAAGRSCGR